MKAMGYDGDRGLSGSVDAAKRVVYDPAWRDVAKDFKDAVLNFVRVKK